MISTKKLRKANKPNTYLLDNKLPGLISLDEVKDIMCIHEQTLKNRIAYTGLPMFIWGGSTYIERVQMFRLDKDWRKYVTGEWRKILDERNAEKRKKRKEKREQDILRIKGMKEVKRHKILESDYFRYVGITGIREFIPVTECIHWPNVDKIQKMVRSGEIVVYRKEKESKTCL